VNGEDEGGREAEEVREPEPEVNAVWADVADHADEGEREHDGLGEEHAEVQDKWDAVEALLVERHVGLPPPEDGVAVEHIEVCRLCPPRPLFPIVSRRMRHLQCMLSDDQKKWLDSC
jgi:hypothetical protein